MRVDMHAHFAAPPLLDYIRRNPDRLQTQIVTEDGREYIKHSAGFKYPNFKEFSDYETLCRSMDKMRVTKSVLSVNPNFFYYWIEDSTEALQAARLSNDWIAAFRDEHPDRIGGMATVPMQNIDLALKELDRACTDLGLRALAIGSMINDKQLDEEEFFPIYEYCAQNGVLLYLHPYYTGPKPQMTRYYNTNIVGNVLETCMAINHLIYGGVFEKYPELKVFTSHAGGFFPYQLGRMIHGYNVRPEPKARLEKGPEHYVDNIYYDTITHWNPALRFLIDTFGSDHVMLGTDCPFDMGDYRPVDRIEELGLTEDQLDDVAWKNARRLTGD